MKSMNRCYQTDYYDFRNGNYLFSKTRRSTPAGNLLLKEHPVLDEDSQVVYFVSKLLDACPRSMEVNEDDTMNDEELMDNGLASNFEDNILTIARPNEYSASLVSYKVYSSLGKLIFQIESNNSITSIDFNTYSSGLYFVVNTTTGESIKLMKP